MVTIGDVAGAAEKHDPKCDSQMQQDLMDCAWNEFHQSDLRLNKLFQKMVMEAKQEDKGDRQDDDNVGNYETDLRKAQKAWVAFRDAECARTSAPNRLRYGREGDFDFAYCQKKLTNERIKQLSQIIDRGTSENN